MGESEREAHADALLPTMTNHRRHLHAQPEVGLELPDTHEYVATVLRALGLQPEVRPAGGVTVRISGRGAGRGLRVLRADMDALPLQEETGLPFASTRAGVMHACGHDLHTAVLLGAAELFTVRPPRHDVVLAFQPGEESDRGALRVLAHDNLTGLQDAVAFAMHVNAVQPVGTVTTRPGVFMAHGDWFRVDFAGPGGHASAPHLAANPVRAMADWVDGLAAVVSDLAAREALVATATEALSGSAVNVIPARGSLRGTLRTLSVEQRDLLHERMGALTRAVAAQHGLHAELELTAGYPAVVNHERVVDAVLAGLQREPGRSIAVPMPAPSMVIEDFAYFLQRWPGAMVYVGAQVGTATAFNHSGHALFAEEAMVTALALHAMVADLDL